eukprot:TRINITY_DN4684_c0_g1_i1.p1 TRINITY_DN4684_c0_g1~~TRINITY_DN4684_c0_g1_i1.p1  ORF type:complete len:289 (+),score=65.36 TRINITY_DN4684_c0_g1_i1:62-928(+)
MDSITGGSSESKKTWKHELFDHLAASKFRNSDGLMSANEYRRKIQRETLAESSRPINLDMRSQAKVVHREHGCRHGRHDSLIVGDLKSAVKLPPNTELNDWLALNVVDFYNQINLVYGALVEHCSEEQCSHEAAGNRYFDDTSREGPIEISPGKFVKHTMDWVRSLFESELVFPMKEGATFAPTFRLTVTSVCSRLMRVYVHFFTAHADDANALGIGSHVALMFEHFYNFVTAFDLVKPADMVPIKAVIDRINQDGQPQDVHDTTAIKGVIGRSIQEGQPQEVHVQSF